MKLTKTKLDGIMMVGYVVALVLVGLVGYNVFKLLQIIL